MFDKRTVVLMVKIIGVYLILCVPVVVWPDLLDNAFGFVIALPMISVYVFDALGIPGLLENAGKCGWGWCPPTLFGVLFVGVFWLMTVWLLAGLIVHMTRAPEAEDEQPRLGFRSFPPE